LSSLKSVVKKAKIQKTTVTSDGWKNLANWRSLKKASSYDEVRAMLGEHEKVSASDRFTEWKYSNRSDALYMKT